MFFSKSKFLGLVLLLLSVNGFSNVITVESQAVGVGITSDAALRDAISKAVGQVSGLTEKTTSTMTYEIFNEEEQSDGGQAITNKFSNHQSKKTQIETQGLVKSYKILDEYSDEEGNFFVKISAEIYRYDLDASTQRKKIALLPVANNYSGLDNLNVNLPDLLTKYIESELVQSRRFSVLSRRDIDLVAQEQKFISGNNVHHAELAKLGNLLGGDVVVAVSIEYLSFKADKKLVKLTGQEILVSSGELKIFLKAISAVTGEIKFSNQYISKISRDVLDIDDLSREVARNAISDFTARIYPARIVSVNENNLVLNIGGKSALKNSEYTVYSEGQLIVDPYTGESLGAVENEIGKIRIARVESKFSTAEILEGGPFHVGMVARLNSNIQMPENAQILPIPSTTGFKLPFD